MDLRPSSLPSITKPHILYALLTRNLACRCSCTPVVPGFRLKQEEQEPKAILSYKAGSRYA